ncbi:helix-turn-helix domain-containing protein [Ligilactobacillus cholophilus]|uniref:helix-turn-helix domain-containing protein n=1 Tax=Ligilactobacillus cholophilus TaxID=3050131 RepID=UPI0025B25E5E|nr:helix-turn-helix transcriptional regulator [Ligilactobacillus cholophilus]
MLLNKQIKKYREKLGMSQDKLAEMLYVTRQSVSKWESGDVVPDLEKIIKMSKIFNVSLDNLILGVDDQKKSVDTDEFVLNPKTNLYVRRYGKMNFWDFLAKYWWIVFPTLIIIVLFL